MIQQPYLITLQKVAGKSGFLSYMDEGADLPITVKRFYWIYDSEEGAERGNHAHVNSDRVLVCIKGSLEIKIEDPAGKKYTFLLDDPSKVLFFPHGYWINITFAKDSILFVASSSVFKEDVLITDYQEFKKLALEKILAKQG